MPTVVLADDNEVLANFTGYSLKAAIPDLHTVVAPTCEQTRSVVLRLQPDVVVLDQMMPDGDGLALLPWLRESAPASRVIVATGDLERGAREQLLGEGVFAVLVKPFETERIVHAVHEALAARPSLSPSRNAGMEGPAPPINRHRVMNRLAELLAGLRAFGADLRAEAHDAEAVRRLTDEYVDRLVGTVRDVTELVRRPGHGSSNGAPR